ncbi:hypothetical protein QYF36_008155 [Acer negundo]|nr:hypothetical protein QYF36_008155 [Acer negundo]
MNSSLLEVIISHQLEEVVNNLDSNETEITAINGEEIVGCASGMEIFGLGEKTIGALPIIQDIHSPPKGITRETYGYSLKPNPDHFHSSFKCGPIRDIEVEEPISNFYSSTSCSDSPSLSSRLARKTSRVTAPGEDGEFYNSKKARRMVGNSESKVESSKVSTEGVSFGEFTSDLVSPI